MRDEFDAAIYCFALAGFGFVMNKPIGGAVGVLFGSGRNGRHPYIKLKSGRYLVPDLTAAGVVLLGVILLVAGIVKSIN